MRPPAKDHCDLGPTPAINSAMVKTESVAELGPLWLTEIFGGITIHYLNIMRWEIENKRRFKVNFMEVGIMT